MLSKRFRATSLLAGGILALAISPALLRNRADGSSAGASDSLRPPAKIFAASCATCHGANGLGGHPSWTMPSRIAPRIARGFGSRNYSLEENYKFAVRNGKWRPGTGFTNAMPAFGLNEISDAELDALLLWMIYAAPLGESDPTNGVPPPDKPAGREIRLEIRDESPWFIDDGTDNRDPFSDPRRVVLSPGEYIKVVNVGKTWHTVSNTVEGVDTGFIGNALNIPGQDVGYYYLEIQDLLNGAFKYFCKLHPYMQVEIVTPGTDPLPLTWASKTPIPPPASPGMGEVWVGLQTYQNPSGQDGAVNVIRASDWSRVLIPNVGNNPHNGWYGRAIDTNGTHREVALFASWHDVGVTVVDANAKTILGSFPIGAAPAHVITAPRRPDANTKADRFFVTLMGSNKVQEVRPLLDLRAGAPALPPISQSQGQKGRPGISPHGIWFADDGDHLFTANTLGNSISMYSASDTWSDRQGRQGTGCEVAQTPTGGRAPLAVSVMNTGNVNSRTWTVFSNNAITSDISIFFANANNNTLTRVAAPEAFRNAMGNFELRDETADPVRWVRMPIQCIVTPPDATEHGRYLVICNKASFNVTILPLDENGQPTGIYNFPAGLGSHGVAFGKKYMKDSRKVSYYAYVTNTFENYISVYDLGLLEEMRDLERVGSEPPAFRPGGADESIVLEGYAALLLTGANRATVPLTLLSPDARGIVHVGDVPLDTAGPLRRCFLKEHVWVDLPGVGEMMLDLDLTTESGAMGVFCRPAGSPWGR
ncbi:MAG: hypothetical protein AKCLJLPJ_02593 [Fimbriimonadales bacterium]|nr:hypothetical protein [Fimbriimonadales bacterium]